MNIRILISFFLFLLSYNLIFSQNIQKEPIKLGIDNLIDSGFNEILGKNVAILTNFTGRTSSGKLTAEILAKSDANFNLKEIFTPEHGFFTCVPAGENVPDSKIFGLPVFSLYGGNRKPSKYQLKNIDVILIDLQDIGIRSYTYISTMYNVMAAAAENNIEVIVLDRPNPIGGLIVDGNIIEKGCESFVGIIPVPYIHGCTIGELAEMLNEEGWLPKNSKSEQLTCNLKIIKMTGWQRSMRWEDTGLQWFPSSPNIPTVDALRGAAMLGVFGELGIISIGIGTALPFQYIGNPDLQPEKTDSIMENLELPGVDLFKTKYQPNFARAANKECSGYLLKFHNDNSFAPFTSGFQIILAIKKLYPEWFKKNSISDSAIKMFNKVCGTKNMLSILLWGSEDEILTKIKSGLDNFIQMRKKYLLY